MATPPLTAEQARVVHHDPARHATVLAVAGAGKTTTLVHRVAYLLAQGTPASRVRAVMFNRAARASFEEKLSALGVPTGQGGVRVQTFHALGLDIVRRTAEASGGGVALRRSPLGGAELRATFGRAAAGDGEPAST